MAGHGADAWQLSTGEDLRYQTTEGPRPGRLGRLIYRYADRVLAVANGNQEVQAAFLRVIHLLDRPAALFHPRVLLPALARRHAEPLGPRRSTNRQHLAATGRPPNPTPMTRHPVVPTAAGQGPTPSPPGSRVVSAAPASSWAGFAAPPIWAAVSAHER